MNREATTHSDDHSQTVRGVRQWQMAAGLAIVIGLALGFITQQLQAVFDLGWNVAANSGAVWLAGAFATGALLALLGVRHGVLAALSGVVTLLCAVIGYYVSARIFAGAPAGTSSVIIWLGMAIVGGPFYGLAGNWWRSGTSGTRWQHIAALALLGAVFIAEGANHLLRVKTQGNAGWVLIALGLLVPLLLGRSNRDRLLGFTVTPVVALVGYPVYPLLDRVLSTV